MELEELWDMQLEHFGVKGMKWGRRKDGASETTPKPKSTLRKYVDSNRRELGMRKMLKDVDTLPDAEVVRRVNCVRNENDFRRAIDNTAFVNNKRRKQLRDEYFNRENLSDSELQERVRRLNLEDNLKGKWSEHLNLRERPQTNSLNPYPLTHSIDIQTPKRRYSLQLETRNTTHISTKH